MNRLCNAICSRCRHDLLRPSAAGSKLFSRGRSATAVNRRLPIRSKAIPHASGFGAPPLKKPETSPPEPLLSHTSVESHLANNVKMWASEQRLVYRLESFGFSDPDIGPMITCFMTAVRQNAVISALGYDEEYLTRMADDLSQPSEKFDMLDRWLTKLLFEWGDHPAGRAALKDVVTPSTISKLSELFQAADMSKLMNLYPMTRSSRRRKIIMHVGPTNSGKTHHALRALAAARTGVYAGPLRLLAHEIWERLNKGQIIPAGVEADEEEVDKDPSSTFDVGTQPIIRKSGDKRYARICNLITGEEQKIVDENATLTSCTVEMASITQRFEVAVVDEIQMLSNPERGGGWLRALLGLNAAEVHLCGEETAVPLVKSLLRDSGDDIVVKRYERLTPLRVEDSSLHGDLSKIKKGDCLVTFSRKQIFALKKSIQASTGMQCAVAYGRLPPEIRSEQAALFNTPGSGYDVLIGSDAIGMGLNLKIKRIVLEAVHKWNGVRQILLSNSDIKQIAGRAGRYGMHGDSNAGGTTTTLYQPDLQNLRRALAAPIKYLKQARISTYGDTYKAVAAVLSADTVPVTIADVFYYVAKLPPNCELEDVRKMRLRYGAFNEKQGDMTLDAQLVFHMSPTPSHDPLAQTALRAAIRIYCEDFRVRLKDVLREASLLEEYEKAMQIVKEGSSIGNTQHALETLESVHKIIVMYLWLSYRFPVAFIDQEEAFKRRDETEQAMQRCLELVSVVKRGKQRPKTILRQDEPIKYTTHSALRLAAFQKRSDILEHHKDLYQQPGAPHELKKDARK
ncbi:P-loop containing nucleoside triphosphate hydrolase protein [Rhodofomes roseus]|uniref:P-loop containing nucleoside triphosphate hydrolase protein n=1 Tax=Rhodofomes roseus TaxID=34475 RepID=A0ABQ8KUV2_9APHY|nr:P-loop containing nucleoside triphosphate hydrolase protein [Rhodofomes roseus]KAH9842458.1 P-loop containing nucleoside triphosphate hydrolase protein [Rhodofomes roseus]